MIFKEGVVSRVTITAPTGGTVNKRPIVVGNLTLIPVETKSAAQSVVCEVGHGARYDDVPRNTGDAAWTAGADVYFDPATANRHFTTTAGTLKRCGQVRVAATTSAATGSILFFSQHSAPS